MTSVLAQQGNPAQGAQDAARVGSEAEAVLEREGGGAMLHSVVILVPSSSYLLLSLVISSSWYGSLVILVRFTLIPKP